MTRRIALLFLAALLALAAACQPANPSSRAGSEGVSSRAADAPSGQAGGTSGASGRAARITIGVTSVIDTRNPYGESAALHYGLWCEMLGCLLSYSFDQGDYVPSLAASWEVTDPLTWVFHLRPD